MRALEEETVPLEQKRDTGVRIFQNAVAFLGGEFFYRLINFFACILIARSLGGEGYGQFSFIYVYLSFFEIFVQFGLNPVLTRELSQQSEAAPRILGNALILRTALICFSLPMVWGLIRLAGYPVTVQQGVWLASFQLFLTLRPVFEATFRVQLLMIYPALWNAVRALLNLGLIAVVTLYSPSLPLYIAAYFVSGVVGLAGIAYSSSRRVPFDFQIKKSLVAHLMRQSFPMVLSGYLTLIYYRVDVMMLSFMRTFKEVGYYSVATRLTESLNMLHGALLVSFFPLFARAFKESRSEFEALFSNAFKWLSLAGLPLVLGGTLVAKDLILLFFGAEYAPSGTTFMILLGYTFFCFIGSLLANVLIASGKQVADMWISFFLALFNIALNVFLIPFYSYNGAAIATVLTEVVGVGIYFWYGARNADIRLFFPRREWWSALKINLLFLALLLSVRWLFSLSALPLILAGAFIYAGLLFLFRVISWRMLKTYAFQ